MKTYENLNFEYKILCMQFAMDSFAHENKIDGSELINWILMKWINNYNESVRFFCRAERRDKEAISKADLSTSERF